MRPRLSRPACSRRGFTLLEMLVTVALVVLIMTIIASIFSSATGAIHSTQVAADLDQSLRRLESTIRQDLKGVTARMTPSLNPLLNLGYFEYGENELADAQQEDSDDYIAMTVKAPEGQPFVGRLVVSVPSTNGNVLQQITFTSEFAEVIYFVRNYDLHRRVLLIAPERKGSLVSPNDQSGVIGFVQNASFPSPLFPTLLASWQGMNDISARANDDFVNGFPTSATPIPNTLGDVTNRHWRFSKPRFSADYTDNSTGANSPDGLPDDADPNPNGGAPGNGIPDYYPTLYSPLPVGLMNEPNPPPRVVNLDRMPFPYVFPGAYSVPSASGTQSYHGMPALVGPAPLPFANHSPIDIGDSLPIPTTNAQHQTWWGFPTWRETMSPTWRDPIHSPNLPSAAQPNGLSWMNRLPLPPVADQPFNDGAGNGPGANPNFVMPDFVWQDDLLQTGVRGFDVKVYDQAAQGYRDLGYGQFDTLGSGTPLYYDAVNNLSSFSNSNPPVTPLYYVRAVETLGTFAHEGRIPPLVNDNRADPHWPLLLPNVGDNRSGIVRLERVWDTWSTVYTNAPDVPLNPMQGAPFAQPAYPSYPPPYPAPIRSIQIQIRIQNVPTSDRVRVLTIQQDFTDKL